MEDENIQQPPIVPEIEHLQEAPVVLALPAIVHQPENFLVEEFLEDQQMNEFEGDSDSQNNSEGNNQDNLPSPPVQISENLHVGFVEIHNSHSADSGFTCYQSQNCIPSSNAEVVQIWANHFCNTNRCSASVDIPVKWNYFFTTALMSSSQFNWATSFLQSKTWDFFISNNGEIRFSLPFTCLTTEAISCSSTQAKKNIEVLKELITPPVIAEEPTRTLVNLQEQVQTRNLSL